MRISIAAIVRPLRVPAAIALAANLLCADTTAAGAIVRYEGDAYALADGRLLYRESHWLYDESGAAQRVVLYRCPDGSPFARKHLRVGTNAQAPDFELRDARSGYLEGVRTDAAARRVFVEPGGGERSAALPEDADTVIDAGFDAFVVAHWDALASGASLPLAFVIPSRLAALKFKVRRIGGAAAGPETTLHLRLQMASWYGALLPHIDVFYDAATRQLRRYEGMSNLRDANSNNVEVRIEFPPDRRSDTATMRDVEAAGAAALTGTCRLS